MPKATEVIGNCAKQSFAYFVPHHPGLQLEVTPHYVKQAVCSGGRIRTCETPGYEPGMIPLHHPAIFADKATFAKACLSFVITKLHLTGY